MQLWERSQAEKSNISKFFLCGFIESHQLRLVTPSKATEVVAFSLEINLSYKDGFQS